MPFFICQIVYPRLNARFFEFFPFFIYLFHKIWYNIFRLNKNNHIFLHDEKQNCINFLKISNLNALLLY